MNLTLTGVSLMYGYCYTRISKKPSLLKNGIFIHAVCILLTLMICVRLWLLTEMSQQLLDGFLCN